MWNILATDIQAAIIGGLIMLIGVILGVALTKIAEFIQIANRREKRASWPEYELECKYLHGTNASFNPNDPKMKSFETKVDIQDLKKKGARNINIIGGLRVKKAKFQTTRDEGVYLDVSVLKESKCFTIKVAYMRNGFYYKDYWLGELVNARGTLKDPSYQIKFIPPFNNRWIYYYNLIKKFIR